MAARAGTPGPLLSIAGRDGRPYIRNLASFHSGLDGLAIHQIPEEPNIMTCTHIISGLRIGRARFATVQAACESIEKCFGKEVNFDKPLNELMIDIKFTLCLEKFLRESIQVPKNMSNVIRRDLVAQIQSHGVNGVKKIIKP